MRATKKDKASLLYRGIVARTGMQNADLAEAMGITKPTLQRRLNEPQRFEAIELGVLFRKARLDDEEILKALKAIM